MGSAKLAIVSSCALVLSVAVIVLGKAPPRVVAGRPANTDVASTHGDFAACQRGEELPAHATAVRLSMGSDLGPSVYLKMYEGSRLLTSGSRSPNWTGGSVTVPLTPLERAAPNVKLCVKVAPNSGPLYVYGRQAPASRLAVSDKGQVLAARIGVEYLAAGHGSWWSRALSVARRIGLGHAFGGSGWALLLGLLVAGMFALAIRLAWRELP